MKKKTIFFILLTVLCLKPYVYAGWPINITPEIEGQVLDEITGEPIENALVRLSWSGDYLIGGPGGPGSYKEKIVFVFTGKDGRFKVKKKYFIHIITRFTSLSCIIGHPLYCDKENNNYSICPLGFGLIAIDFYGVNKDYLVENKLVFTKRLLKIEDKYKIDVSTNSTRHFYSHLFSGFIDTVHSEYDYFSVYKRKKNNNHYLNYVVGEFKKIETMLPGSEYAKEISERIRYYEIKVSCK